MLQDSYAPYEVALIVFFVLIMIKKAGEKPSGPARRSTVEGWIGLLFLWRELLEVVWGVDHFEVSLKLQVLIELLRSSVFQGQRPPQIHTAHIVQIPEAVVDMVQFMIEVKSDFVSLSLVTPSIHRNWYTY